MWTVRNCDSNVMKLAEVAPSSLHQTKLTALAFKIILLTHQRPSEGGSSHVASHPAQDEDHPMTHMSNLWPPPQDVHAHKWHHAAPVESSGNNRTVLHDNGGETVNVCSAVAHPSGLLRRILQIVKHKDHHLMLETVDNKAIMNADTKEMMDVMVAAWRIFSWLPRKPTWWIRWFLWVLIIWMPHY